MRSGTLPAPCIADARGRVPRDRRDFVEHFLNPDRVAIVKMDDGSQGFAVVEMILQVRVSRECADTALDPCVAGYVLRFRQPEIFHHAKTLGMGSILRMPKSAASILVCVTESKFVSQRVFLHESESMANANIVVRFRKKTWTIEVGSQHDEEIRARSRSDAGACRRGLRLRARHACGKDCQYERRSEKKCRKVCLNIVELNHVGFLYHPSPKHF
jgi:hypothetical protein